MILTPINGFIMIDLLSPGIGTVLSEGDQTWYQLEEQGPKPRDIIYFNPLSDKLQEYQVNGQTVHLVPFEAIVAIAKCNADGTFDDDE